MILRKCERTYCPSGLEQERGLGHHPDIDSLQHLHTFSFPLKAFMRFISSPFHPLLLPVGVSSVGALDPEEHSDLKAGAIPHSSFLHYAVLFMTGLRLPTPQL